MSIINDIAHQIDENASGFRIADLQEIRKNLKGHERRAGSKIFNDVTIFENYAFHYGGRQELQFNIGIEEINDTQFVRHGVAFSLESSQSLPDISILFPKIQKFNEFIRLYNNQYLDMKFWYYQDGKRSSILPVSIISGNVARANTFIFIGKYQHINNISIKDILSDFDRLLPIYEYVESNAAVLPVVENRTGLQFQAGISKRRTSTTATIEERTFNINLRHNLIQNKLYHKLCRQYGSQNVGTECRTTNGSKIDVVVKKEDEIIYYEIKTSLTAKTSIREAIPQLLEYSYWPGSTIATKLVIASEAVLDSEADNYLDYLRNEFSLPIYYEQVKVE